MPYNDVKLSNYIICICSNVIFRFPFIYTRGRNDKLGEATSGGETTRGKTTREGNSLGAKHPGFRQNAEHSGK